MGWSNLTAPRYHDCSLCGSYGTGAGLFQGPRLPTVPGDLRVASTKLWVSLCIGLEVQGVGQRDYPVPRLAQVPVKTESSRGSQSLTLSLCSRASPSSMLIPDGPPSFTPLSCLCPLAALMDADVASWRIKLQDQCSLVILFPLHESSAHDLLLVCHFDLTLYPKF